MRFGSRSKLEADKWQDKNAPTEPTGADPGASTSLRRTQGHMSHPIPDFKALHAMQQSVLSQRRRAEVHPTVPVEFGLATEARAAERERFEAARRAREAEAEALAAEARRQRELEEEAEVRELRRRAVPRANEVPEWYALAPKKARTETGN